MRLFAAIALDAPTRRALAAAIDALARAIPEGVKWVAPDNLHLTLKFLGEVPDEGLPAVEEALAEAARGAETFEAELTSIGALPPGGRPRVLYAGLAAPPVLARLAADVDAALEAIGFAAETRPFKAHITLGRARQPTRGRARRPRGEPPALREALAAAPPIEGGLPVTHLTLFRSQLSAAGPTYTVVRAFPLGEAAPGP